MTVLTSTSEAMSTAQVLDRSLAEPEDGRASRNGHAATNAHDRPHISTASERPQEERFFRIARLADTAIGVSALLGGFLATTIDRMPAGAREFLEIRMTLKNLLLVAGFATVWRLICVLFGLYDERRTAKP